MRVPIIRDGRHLRPADLLRGETTEWERELRPRGFHVAARAIEFRDGIPGDIGLYLVWGAWASLAN